MGRCIFPYSSTLLGSAGGGGVQRDLHDYAGFGMPRGEPALPCVTRPPSAPHPRHIRRTVYEMTRRIIHGISDGMT